MKETQYEECSLEEATHVEIGGNVYKFGFGKVNREWRYDDLYITVKTDNSRLYAIRADMFNFLGIKPLKEKKLEPIVFVQEAIYQHGRHIINVPDQGIGKRFKCVEILEDEE